jgi:hypothetical protein
VDRDVSGNLTGRFKEMFRSRAEVQWAETFDKLRLPWEYEPLMFDMGPTHFSYTPDFRVTGLSIPDSSRALYIEVKWFPDELDLTKYVRFTEWYNCDLLVLAHRKGGVLKPKKEEYFLIFRCKHCRTYDCFPLNDIPVVERDDHAYDCVPRNGTSPENYEPPGWEYSHAGSQPAACQRKQIERMVVPNYFVIQAGTIGSGRVVLPNRESSEPRITYDSPTPASRAISS